MSRRKSRKHTFRISVTFDKACTSRYALREVRDTIHGTFYTTPISDNDPEEYRVSGFKGDSRDTLRHRAPNSRAPRQRFDCCGCGAAIDVDAVEDWRSFKKLKRKHCEKCAAQAPADPCPYCKKEMQGAEDCENCGCGSPGRATRSIPNYPKQDC